MDPKKDPDVKLKCALLAANPSTAIIKLGPDGRPLRSRDGVQPLSAEQLNEIRNSLVIFEDALGTLSEIVVQP